MSQEPTVPPLDGAERQPPDLEDDAVHVAGPDGEVVAFAPHITWHIDADDFGFVDIGGRDLYPLRHRFELSVGGEASLDFGAFRSLPDSWANQEAVEAYAARAEAACALLLAEPRRRCRRGTASTRYRTGRPTARKARSSWPIS
jgi:hypothetical protein